MKFNSIPGTTNREIVSGFVSTIDPKEKYHDKGAEAIVGKILSCEYEFSVPGATNARTQIIRLAMEYKDASPIVESIKEKIVRLIMPGREKHVIFALKEIVKNDKELFTIYASIFKEKVGMTVDKFVNYQSFELPRIIAGLFLFSVVIRNNARGKETVSLIRHPSFWEKLNIGFLVIDHNKNELVTSVSDIYGLEDYKRACFSKYNSVPTILPTKDVCCFDDIFVCTDIEYGVTRHGSGEKRANQTILDIRKRTRHLLLSAQGGNGKSMRFIHFLFTGLNNIDKLGAIPFYVCLRFYSSKSMSLIVYMYKEVQKVWSDLDFSVFISLINSEKVVLLLDGLDEMTNIAYKKFKDDIASFLEKYSGIQVVLSARPYMGWIDEISGFSQARLCGLTHAQAIELINRVNIYPDDSEKAKKFRKIFEENLWRKKRDLAQNPLLLCAMMTVFHEDDDVPLDGWDFFRRTFEIFASKHDNRKVGFTRVYATGLILSDLKKYLYEFAYNTYIEKAWALDMNRCREIYDSLEVRKKNSNNASCEDFMMDLEKNLSVMQQDAGIYSFFQHAFQEYFAACYMASKSAAWIKGRTDYFNENRERTIHDYAFTLLYDMQTDEVNESIILPQFHKIFSKRDEAKKYAAHLTNCSKKESAFLTGYWSYVLNQYPVFQYHKEVGKDCTFVVEPISTILEFILHYKKYPCERILVDGNEVELEPNSFFHDPIDGNTFIGDEEYSDEIEYLIHGQRVLYNGQRRKYTALYDTWGAKERIELSRDIRFDVADVLKSPSSNSALISCFEAEDFPLMKEYISIKTFYTELKQARSASIHSGEGRK